MRFMQPSVLNGSDWQKEAAGGFAVFSSLLAEKQQGEMSSWGGETQKTAGPVFGMINQSFDNGSKGRIDARSGAIFC